MAWGGGRSGHLLFVDDTERGQGTVQRMLHTFYAGPPPPPPLPFQTHQALDSEDSDVLSCSDISDISEILR